MEQKPQKIEVAPGTLKKLLVDCQELQTYGPATRCGLYRSDQAFLVNEDTLEILAGLGVEQELVNIVRDNGYYIFVTKYIEMRVHLAIFGVRGSFFDLKDALGTPGLEGNIRVTWTHVDLAAVYTGESKDESKSKDKQ